MKLAVIGVGLIGGSWAKALKKSGVVSSVVGIDRSEAHLSEAIELGIIDDKATYDDLAAVDMVFLSIPVDQMVIELPKVLDAVGEQTLVVDAGSTKLQLCEAVASHPKRRNFLAAHPIAGT